MFLQFIFANLHFAITIFASLAFFATGWLYFDSWSLKKETKSPLIRAIGFFLLAFSFVLHATSLQIEIILLFMQLSKIIGLLLIIVSLLKEPVLHKPSETTMSLIAINGSSLFHSLTPISAVLYLLVGLIYIRKSSEGLEVQLKPAGYAFLFLAISELLAISFFWKNTSVVFWSQLLADYSIVFNISHIFQLAGVIILGLWSFGYLRFRLQAQLFITTIALSLAIFLATTFFFTFLLFKNLEQDALSHLTTDVNVMRYTLERIQQEALANAKAIAKDKNTYDAFKSRNTEELYSITSEFMLSQNTSFLSIASSSGEVVMRAEDKERVGDNILNNPVIESAIKGKPLATVTSITDPLPQVHILAAAPIQATASGKIEGAVLTGFIIDSAFVDNIKDVTGLDTTIFAHNKRAATTFVAPDGKSRFIGTEESNAKITDKVLKEKEDFVGSANVLNQPFYVAYSPLKTLHDQVIGMLFVGKLQSALFATAQQSLLYTFLGSVILMLISLPISYFISRWMYKNIEA